MAKRKKRSEIKKDDIDLLQPVDVLALGGSDDPCFGKLHDLAAPECKECGDADFCALVKAQGLNLERVKLETKQRFKDVEEADAEMLKKKQKAKGLIEKYKDKGYKRMKTIIIVSKELALPKDIVKQVYDQI